MALQEQTIDVGLVGGVDEHTHAKHAVRPRVMKNARYRKVNAIAKRYGSVCIGSLNAYFNSVVEGTTPPACDLLVPYLDALVRIGNERLDECKVIGSADTISRDFISECRALRDPVLAGASYVRSVDVAYLTVGGVSYEATIGVGITTDTFQNILIEVKDATTGTRILSRYPIDSVVGAMQGAQVLTVGSVFVFVWKNGTSINAMPYDPTTGTVAGPTTLTSAATSASTFDAAAGTARWFLVYQANAGAKPYTIAAYTAALALVDSDAINETTTEPLVSASVAVETAGNGSYDAMIAFSYVHASNGRFIRATSWNLSVGGALAENFAPVTVETDPAIFSGANSVGVLKLSSTAYLVAWTAPVASSAVPETTGYRQVSSIGVLSGVYTQPRMNLASRPWLSSETGRAYVLAYNTHSTHRTLYVCCLNASTDPLPNYVDAFRWCATVAPRQVSRLFYGPQQGALPHVASAGSGRYLIGATVNSGVDTATDTASSGVRLDLRFASLKRNAVVLNETLYVSGGVPTSYDGQKAMEIGFAYEPDPNYVALSETTGGALQALGVYKVRCTYAHVDARNRRAESRPSTALPGVTDTQLKTLTGVNNALNVTFPGLNLTLRTRNLSAFGNQPRKIRYRTQTAGTTYNRTTATPLKNADLCAVSVASTTPVEDLADTAVANNALLDTGTLVDGTPPSCSYVYASADRLFWVGTDDDAIWYSMAVAPGEQIRARGDFVIDPFEGGRCVAMAGLGDGKFVIFKNDSIWLFYGSGPNDTNTSGSFSTPERIPAEVGCIDPRSVVETPEGVMFLAQSGLCLLARGGAVINVGRGIEDTLGSSVISAAVLSPDQNLVRFCIAGTATVLVYDYFHGGAPQPGSSSPREPVWSVDEYTDPAGAATILSACMFGGKFTFVNSLGHVFQETKTSYFDANGLYTASPVLMDVLCGTVSTAGVQGCQRVWDVTATLERKTAFAGTVTVYTDGDVDSTQTGVFTEPEVTLLARPQIRVHVDKQECQAVAVRFTETGTPGGTGEGPVLYGFSLEVGIERGSRKLPSGQVR